MTKKSHRGSRQVYGKRGGRNGLFSREFLIKFDGLHDIIIILQVHFFRNNLLGFIYGFLKVALVLTIRLDLAVQRVNNENVLWLTQEHLFCIMIMTFPTSEQYYAEALL